MEQGKGNTYTDKGPREEHGRHHGQCEHGYAVSLGLECYICREGACVLGGEMVHLKKEGSVSRFGCGILALRAHQVDSYVCPLEIRRHPPRPESACGLQCFQRVDGIGALQHPGEFFGSECLSLGNSPQVRNMLLDIGQVFPDSMPLDSNLVELFGSTVRARLVLVFLLCSVAVSALPVLMLGSEDRHTIRSNAAL